MSILDTIKEATMDALEIETYPEAAELTAEGIADATDLYGYEAVVIAGDIHGVDNTAIDRRVVVSGKSARKVRTGLRQKYREAFREIEPEEARTSKEKFLAEWWEAAYGE